MATISDLSKFVDAVEREVLSARAMIRLARITKNIIRKRTKSGKGVSVGRKTGKKRKRRLKPLSDSYKARRKDTKVPGDFGRPGKSNLTYTGQLLDSFDVAGRQGVFSVIIPDTRRTKPPLSGGRRNPGTAKHTNSQIAEIVAKNGRPFFDLTKSETRILVKDVEDQVRSVFNRFF